jgi:hypothetical protein
MMGLAAASAVAVYDRVYRFVHGLDRPGAQVGPALCIEIRRCRRARTLPNGTRLAFADRFGVCHLNNRRIAALHVAGDAPLHAGFEFRRQLVASLHALAALAADGRPLSDVRAFAATTTFHSGLAHLGFAVDPQRPRWPGLVAAYQRALLASIRPVGRLRSRRATYREARRLWLSRDHLLLQYLERPDITKAVDA